MFCSKPHGRLVAGNGFARNMVQGLGLAALALTLDVLEQPRLSVNSHTYTLEDRPIILEILAHLGVVFQSCASFD